MARLIFKTAPDFISYLSRFSGTGRMMLLDVTEDKILILRPLVTSRGIDTAEIYGLKDTDKNLVKEAFEGEVYNIKRIIWREEEAVLRTSE